MQAVFIDKQAVDKQESPHSAAFYALCGEGLCIGYDSGDAVSSRAIASWRLRSALICFGNKLRIR